MVHKMSCLSKNKPLELKKHIGAIHSSSKLTLVQRKVANALLYHAYDNLLTRDRHCIHIKTLCNLIGYDSNDHRIVKNALITLISTVIQWNLIEKDKNGSNENVWNASSIIADVSIDGPICFYSYSYNMRKLLYHPEIYGRINMEVQAKFKSTYGLVLYENCIRYQRLNQTQWFDLITFRLLMGVENGKYSIFRDFKKRVIDKAISEVNMYSPICVSIRFKKKNRSVIALQFLIKSNNAILSNIGNENINNISIDLAKFLQSNFGFSNTYAQNIIEFYGANYIMTKIALIRHSESFKSGKITNLSKYLEHALKKDYRSSKFKNNVNDNIVIEQYEKFLNKEIIKIYNELPLKDRDDIDQSFIKYIKSNIHYELYLKEGLSNILVTDRFCFFIKNYKRKILKNIISYETFLISKQSELKNKF